MKRRLVHLLLAASLLIPLAGTAAGTQRQAIIKVGKIRVVQISTARGIFRFSQSGDARFEGCTVEPSFIFSYFAVGQSGGDDIRWQLLLEAKRSNADLRVIYIVNEPSTDGGGRCALAGLELL